MKYLSVFFQFAFIVSAIVCLVNGDFEFAMLDCIFAELINIDLKIGGEDE